MTKPIEGVSERILVCAREEFLEKGYSEASLRTIAAKADTTTGSIYSRFGDKEGLFCAIVEPAAEGLTQIFLKTQEAFHAREAEEQPKVMEDYVVGGMDEMLDYVYDRFDDFRLLLDASYGTKYQDFVEHLVDIETEYTYKYMEATQFLQEGSMITEEFLHIMSRAMFGQYVRSRQTPHGQGYCQKISAYAGEVSLRRMGSHHQAGVKHKIRLLWKITVAVYLKNRRLVETNYQ